MPPAEVNALVYTVGWTCKRYLKRHSCQVCREHLLNVTGQLDSSNKLFCYFKADSKNPDNAFGGLSIPNDSVVEHFREVDGLLRSTLEKAMLGKRVSQMLLLKLSKHNFSNPLHLCSTQQTQTIHLLFIKLKLHYSLKWKNRETQSKFRKKIRN